MTSLPDADAVLATLDPEQREVATALSGPVCVLAGAGTGKTRAITSRIAYGVALRHVRPAAGPGRHLHRPGRRRDAHPAARPGRRRRAGPHLPRGRAAPAALLLAPARGRRAARRWSSTRPPWWPRPPSRVRLATDRATVRDLAGEVEWAKVTMTDKDDYPAAAAKVGRTPPAGLTPEAVVRLLTAYDLVKRERHVIDFEDVLLYTVGLIAEHRQVADAVRAQYQHLVVDEYQDVSPLQQALLDQWLGGSDEVCVVGDPHQTIYSFAGASPEFLLGFRERHPGRPGGAAGPRLPLDAAGRRPGQPAGRRRPRSGGTAGSSWSPSASPARRRTCASCPTSRPRPRWVAERVAGPGRRGARRRREIAVLFRTNGQSETYEQALADAGVPYLLRGGERFFDRPEVREAPAAAARRGPLRSTTPRAPTLPAHGPGGPLRRRAGPPSRPPAAARSATGGSRWPRWPGSPTTWRRSGPRPRCATSSPSSTSGPTPSTRPTVDGVTLASLHAAKGLEWDAVFLVGVTDGMIPITYAETPEQVEEERRLLYVGVTRAREHLAVDLVAVPVARRPRVAAARRASSTACTRAAPAAPAAARGAGKRKGPAVVPGVRHGADRAGGPQARPLRGLPVAPTTRRSSSGCASGAPSRRRRSRCRRTSSSPTPR